ncbi:MAG: carbon storage regulator CsrA, partial [Thermoguttaceae bacterium]|nr:carbon storage regulator CsrA [Thermoguttaceae bacterium]
MLVLSRYKDQSIYIGDDIVVTIVDVRGDRIRLGVEAPPNIPVHRQEIYEEIKRKKDPSEIPEIRAKGSGRVDIDRNGFTEELRAVREYYANSTAVVFGGWVSASAAQCLEKALNFGLEWLEVGYSNEQLRAYLARPDVRLFVVQEPFCSTSARFTDEIRAAGKDVVSYGHTILTAEKLAKSIYSQVLASKKALVAEECASSHAGAPLRSRRL